MTKSGNEFHSLIAKGKRRINMYFFWLQAGYILSYDHETYALLAKLSAVYFVKRLKTVHLAVSS